VIRRVEDLADRRSQVPNRALDPLLQGHVGGAAALTPTAQSDEDVVLLDVDQLDPPAVLRDGRVDLPFEQVLDGPPEVPLEGSAAK
jgi:hypothetical protein